MNAAKNAKPELRTTTIGGKETYYIGGRETYYRMLSRSLGRQLDPAVADVIQMWDKV